MKDCFTLQPPCKQTPLAHRLQPISRRSPQFEWKRNRGRETPSLLLRQTATYKSSSSLRRRSEAASSRIFSSFCLHLYGNHTSGGGGGCFVAFFHLSLLLDDVFCVRNCLRRLKSRRIQSRQSQQQKKTNTSFRVSN